ncbi:MAG TPA: L-threonylcarbamoyladenylate synthase [Egibacteraceae bacterium]|nr:L-threonylcarbamoyladenylate synthase [Egibacteraceae bacterium]
MSDIVALDDADEAHTRAVGALRAGDLVVVPTDTVYGVVADAFSRPATGRLHALKRRGPDVPLPVVVRSPRQVSGLVEHVPEAAERLMASYWPGPVTLVLPAAPGMTWDLGDTRGSVSLRMPAADFLLDLVAEIGPLACTGANRRDVPLAADVAEVRRQLRADVALYVDGGRRDGPPSTVVDVTRDGAHVLRPGAIAEAHIRQVADGTVGWGQRPAPGDLDEPSTHRHDPA